MHPMITASEICDRIGRKKLAERLGVGRTAISNAAVDGRFPAKWFMVIKTLCDEEGVECPLLLFNFVTADLPDGQSLDGDFPPQEAAE